VVEKPNVLRATGGLMLEEARRVAAAFPGIPLHETNIDYQCMALLAAPERYDVLVAENLFGDILSDLAAQLVGGPGFAASANLGDDFAVFEPVHGSAPDIAGRGVVNPIAMLESVRLMLQWLGEAERAARLGAAIEAVVAEGRVRTPDMGGGATTGEMAAAVAERC
jgi:3-isopropylmalate dehydrogenase